MTWGKLVGLEPVNDLYLLGVYTLLFSELQQKGRQSISLDSTLETSWFLATKTSRLAVESQESPFLLAAI